MMNDLSIKRGWRKVKFGDVVRLSKARCKDPLAEGYERYVGLEHLEPGDLRIRSWGNVADGVTFTNVFKPGQVLFGKRRAYQRKVAVADFAGVCSGDIYVLESQDAKILLPELLPFICQTDAFFEYAIGTSAGSLSPRTNWKSLAEFRFVLPLLLDQKQIAKALWANEDTRRAYEDAMNVGTELLQSVIIELLGISSAKVVIDVIRGDSQATENNLPIRNVEDICVKYRQGVQVGPFGGSVSSKYFQSTGIPVLKINNISKNFSLDLTDQVFISDDHANELGDRYRVQEGDLVTAAQATIGRSALISKQLEGAVISQHLIRVAPDPAYCLPSWLLLCFSTPLVIRQLKSVTQGGTRAGLNTQDVAYIRLPIPDIESQKNILKFVDGQRGGISDIQHRFDMVTELGKIMRLDLLGSW